MEKLRLGQYSKTDGADGRPVPPRGYSKNGARLVSTKKKGRKGRALSDTVKLSKFASKFVETGNGTDAAMEVYGCVDRASGANMSSRLTRDPQVKVMIKEAMDNQRVTPDFIVSKLKGLAEGAEKETNQIRSLELLAKIKHLFAEKSERVNWNVTLTPEQVERLITRRQASGDTSPSGPVIVHDDPDAEV